MATYISNAFSFNMVSSDVLATPGYLTFAPMSAEDVSRAINMHGNVISVVGHADTAALFTKVLGNGIPCNRVSLTLVKGDVLIVGQYKGPRLPEGTSELPEGAQIDWLRVSL